MGKLEARCCWLNELFGANMARSTYVKWKDKGACMLSIFAIHYNEYWSPHISAAGTITGNHGNGQNELIDCCFIHFPSCVTSCIATVQDKFCLWVLRLFDHETTCERLLNGYLRIPWQLEHLWGCATHRKNNYLSTGILSNGIVSTWYISSQSNFKTTEKKQVSIWTLASLIFHPVVRWNLQINDINN